jgi:hypothetical protein
MISKPTAKNEILKQITKISKEIQKWDKISNKRTLTFSEQTDQNVRIGWERGLSWSFTAIDLDEKGKLAETLKSLIGG